MQVRFRNPIGGLACFGSVKLRSKCFRKLCALNFEMVPVSPMMYTNIPHVRNNFLRNIDPDSLIKQWKTQQSIVLKQ